MGKRSSRGLSGFLIAFCTGAAITLGWSSYGAAARQMIASSYPQLAWLAPQRALTAQKAPYAQQFDTVLRDLHEMRRSLDRIVAGQELITRSIDEITTSIAAGQLQIMRSTDQTAAPNASGQEQMTRNVDQTTAAIGQAPSAKASGVMADGRGDAASSQPTARLNTKPTPPQRLLEKGKQPFAASGHDAPCFPSASSVQQNHPGEWPTWTLKAPGHEGTMCWYAAARPKDHRPRRSDRRSEMMPKDKEPFGTAENDLFAPFRKGQDQSPGAAAIHP